MGKKRILVTNDDGIFAPGLKALVNVARDFGEVIVVAPNSPQSGTGHAITINQPLRIHRIETFQGIEAYECSGTPVDCVKLAKNILLKGRPVDLCLSGINHGSNASINIIYSGTLSAAMEASLELIPSIGFSLLDYSFDADFSASEEYVREIVAQAIHNGIQDCKLLNVNIPKLPKEQLRGIRMCRQCEGRWDEEYQESKDPRGESYYWLTGKFIEQNAMEGTDIWALNNGYISIVPSGHDLTAYKALHNNDHFHRDSSDIGVHVSLPGPR
ncbi:MAG: 5'/3'-nucleotidase SurE [Saprospiraceae bacterium]|jgi:5'-nucleotidase|nr:5'/3'-nucleotidase SurE [Saprospiraceae bacterium]MBP9211014.1 5'/3'-nucleotidase SurE [Saprospiraceae bacterium]